jgi:hypothetical protein
MELQPSGQLDSLNVEELRRKKTPTISEMPTGQKCECTEAGIFAAPEHSREIEGDKIQNPASSQEKRNRAVDGGEAEMAFGCAPAIS